MSATFADAQTLVQGLIRTVDNNGSPICFYVDATCNYINSACCGPRCMIDGSIYFVDCITELPKNITPNPIAYHVEYVNGTWQWAHICDTNGDCKLCDCAYIADEWVSKSENGINLTDHQALANLAQYLYNCCAAAVPNPYDCDSLTVEGPAICIRFRRWCCNGKLTRLECTLYKCGEEENVILTDNFSLHYHSGEEHEHDSYDIFADPDNPCTLSEEQRRILLQIFLSNQGYDPCNTAIPNASKNQPKE